MATQLTDIAGRSYGTVHARIVLGYADGTDTGANPDFFAPESSFVTFTPVYPFVRISDGGGNTNGLLVLNEPTVCKIDPKTGHLLGPDGNKGVRLLAEPGLVNHPERSTVGVEYNVTFTGEASRLPSHKILLKPGSTLNLFTTVE